MARSGIISAVIVLVGIAAFYLVLAFAGEFTVAGEGKECLDDGGVCGSGPPTTGGRTTEETTFDNGLECSGATRHVILDYVLGAKGEKVSPVKLARRYFSKQIEEGDVVELADHTQQGDTKTVRVVRDGRVVALIEYSRAGGGWLLGSYEACTGF